MSDYEICAAVINDLEFDARVWKEARSLADAGYRVRLVGCAYEIDRTRRRRQGAIDVVEVPLGTRKRVSTSRRAMTLLTVWKEIVCTRARVYHAHNIHVAPAAWVAARLRRASLVYDGHELYGEAVDIDREGIARPPSPRARLAAAGARRVERFMIVHADAVITTNHSRAEVLRQRHGRADIEIIGNVPYPVDRVEAVDPGYPADRTILLYQGGIYARGRAFKEAVEALRLLPDVHFVIIGFGRASELALVREWAKEAGVDDRVTFLPPRPFDELVASAAAAHVGIVPLKPISTNSILGDTNKLFEYLMAGLPVVASDLPEIRKVVTEGDPAVGELFDPSSPESIADAVTRVIADPDRYRRRRVEARRLAQERYNWRFEEQRLIEIYARLGARTTEATERAV